MTRHMSVGRVKPIVDRTGAESSSYQYLREGYKNAEEAGASRFHLGFELGATREGIYRLLMADDGKSMTAQELPSFVNKYGGGGKPIGGHHENFGVGLKSSTLPWNHHGVLVVAQRDGVTNLIQLHLDEDADEYGLRQWIAQDESGVDELVDVLPIAARDDAGRWIPLVDQDLEPVKGTRIRDLLEAFISEDQGTIIILCGNTGTENTYLATGAGGEMAPGPHTGIGTYISKRFGTLKLKVTVTEPRTGDASDWPTSPDDFRSTVLSSATNRGWKTKNRNPIGIGDFLQNGGDRGAKKPKAIGTVTFEDKTRCSWYLLPENDTYDGKGAGGVYWTPTIAVQYGDEIYSWGTSQRDRFRQFGISRTAVIERCTIVLEPPRNNGGPGVYPDSSRSRLLWTGGRDLPWAQWARQFQANMPAEIEQALQDATCALSRLDADEELSDSQKKRLNSVTRRIQSAWRRLWRPKDGVAKQQVVKVRSLGNVGASVAAGGTGGGGGSGGGGQRNPNNSSAKRIGRGNGDETLAENPAGGDEERFVDDPAGQERHMVETPRPDKLPGLDWLPGSEFEDAAMIARFDEVAFKIEANANCPIIRDSLDYWTSENPGLKAEDIDAAVRKVYGLKLRTAVAHMLTAQRRCQITREQLEQVLSPPGLTMAAAGFLVEDTVLAGDIGALEGRRRKNMKATGV